MEDQVFEWDEKKRISNLSKHKLDFEDAPLIFEEPYIFGKAKTVDGELREIMTGLIDDRYATVVITRRGSAIRVISLRSASDGERRKHQQLFGG